jgi:hypothetical protein
MTAPNFLTYEGDVADGVNPYRPGINDVGGAAKIDDQNAPPDPVTMPTAAEWNEFSLLLVAFAKVTGAALIYVSNSGTPTISGLRAASSIILAGDFTVTHNGTGDTSISCPATKIMAPFACLAFTQAAGDLRASGRLNGTGDGVRIETRNGAGTLTDCDFVCMWL